MIYDQKVWKNLRNALNKSVVYVDSKNCFRATDAMVVEIAEDGLSVTRSIPILTSGGQFVERDQRRVQRLVRRLKRMGYSELWHQNVMPENGIAGIIRMQTPRTKH